MTPTPPSAKRTVRCPQCGARLGVHAEDVGKKARCRECGTVFRLGGPAAPPSGVQAAAPPGGDPAAQGPPAEPKRPATVSFSCELCQTRLTTATANVGRKLVCPDCGRENLVPPAPEIKPVAKPAAMRGAQYGLWDVDRAPAAHRLDELNRHLHPVVCELCQTLMYGTDEQIGKKIRCVDCNHLNVVHRRPAEKPKGPVLVPAGEEYQLDESSPPPPRPAFVPLTERAAELRRAARAETQAAAPSTPDAPPVSRIADPNPLPSKRRPAADGSHSTSHPRVERRTTAPRRPAIPLLQGVWRMLLTSEIGLRWIGQSLVLAIILRLGVGIFNAMGYQALSVLPMFAASCFIGGAWLLSTLPLWLAIVVESSEGNEQLEDPPSWLSFDVAESGFIAIAMAAAAFPAWLTTKAAFALEPPWQLAIVAATWLGSFPFLLLSALEQNSAFAIVSPRIGFSLLRCAGPWLLFLAEACGLAAGAGYVVWYALNGPSALWYLLPWLATAAALVYMRLIGRLAWWIAEMTPAPAEDDAERPATTLA